MLLAKYSRTILLKQPMVKFTYNDHNNDQWRSWITANLAEPDFGIKSVVWPKWTEARLACRVLCPQSCGYQPKSFQRTNRRIGRSLFIQSSFNSPPAHPNPTFIFKPISFMDWTGQLQGSYERLYVSEWLRKSTPYMFKCEVEFISFLHRWPHFHPSPLSQSQCSERAKAPTV